jgi:hypothetical protein
MPMKAVLVVLAVMVSVDAFALTVFPEGVKRIIASLSPRELQVVGFIESLLALALVYFIVNSATW